MKIHKSQQPRSRRRQNGIVMIVALVAIVAMTYAVYAMLRASSSSLGIAGNLAFKQNATSAGDLGVEHALTWLKGKSSTQLSADIGPGYVSTWDTSFDPLKYAWSAGTNAIEVTADDGAGNRVMYVIHRLCKITGSFNLPAQECVRPSSLNSVGAGSAIGAGGGGASAVVAVVPRPYFRITTRVEGPRNTLSYVQVIMY